MNPFPQRKESDKYSKVMSVQQNNEVQGSDKSVFGLSESSSVKNMSPNNNLRSTKNKSVFTFFEKPNPNPH